MKQRLSIDIKLTGEFPIDDEREFVNTITRAVRRVLSDIPDWHDMHHMQAEYYSARRSRASKRKMVVHFSSKPESDV